jgi:hypothetical protein
MSVQSWYDRDVSDVAGLLAEEHVARTLLKEADLASSLRDVGGQLQGLASDAGKRFSEFGQNFGPQLQEYGGKAMDWLNDPNNQAARHALTGAGIGGLVGAGSQLFRDEEDRQYGSSAVHGALAGGALGGGLGLMRQNMRGLTPDGGAAPKPEAGPAEQPATGSQPPAAAQTGGDNIDQQIADLNSQIETATQGQTDAINKNMSTGVQRGLLAAPATSAAMTAVDNRPGASILRGARDLGESDVGSASTATAVRGLSRPLTSQPLNRAGFSAYFDPALPGSTTSFETVPDLDNPLGQMMQGRTDLTPGTPGTRGNPVTTRTPGRLFAQLDAPNRHIPGLTNAQVRDLLKRGRRWPTTTNLISSAGVGLLPMALAALQSYNVDDAQKQLANTLSGGQN